MPTTQRRERDLRRREDLILDAAEDLLVTHGYLGLNLDRLAERVEYSKGTLYNHLETTEDIVLALASRHLTERVRLFERAAAFAGRNRERMVAIGIADDVLAAGETSPFQVMQMAKTPSLWEKTSPVRRAQYARQEARCSEILEEVVRAGVAEGVKRRRCPAAPENACAIRYSPPALSTGLPAPPARSSVGHDANSPPAGWRMAGGRAARLAGTDPTGVC